MTFKTEGIVNMYNHILMGQRLMGQSANDEAHYTYPICLICQQNVINLTWQYALIVIGGL